jgi:predicted transcriptional regulator
MEVRMPYDPELDKKVFYETKEFDSTRVTVGVFSYNNGEKKLQLSRENVDQTGEWRFAKLGRMTKDEVEAVLPLIQAALEHME